MKKIVLSLCLMISCSLIFAQGKFEEVIYLKNGSVIHGMVVEFVPNTSIKIKSGENLFSYKFDEIEKITREEPAESKGGYDYKKKGYVGIVEIGLTDFPPVGGGSNLPMATINVINGYQFNPYVFLGGGVGADISSQNIFNIPVFLDARFNFTKTRVSPFFDLPIGYNLQIVRTPAYDSYGYSQAATQTLSHGLVFNPSFGVRIAVNKKMAVSIGVGYKLLAINQSVTDYSGNTTSAFGLIHGFTVKAAFHF